MKFLIVATSILLLLSCSNKPSKVTRKLPDTSAIIEALYVIDGNTLMLTGGPVKRIVTTVPKPDTTEDDPDKKIINLVTDTFYLLPNLDTTLIMKDKDGKPVFEKDGKPKYGNSFKFPYHLDKKYVQETHISFPDVK